MNYSVMFSSAGVGETYLKDIGFECVVANELIEERAKFHSHLHPNAHMVTGDITNDEIFKDFVDSSIVNNVDFLLATPPCQGFSLSGKNKNLEQMINDERNFLVFKVIEAINQIKPSYTLIENVPRFLKMHFPYKGKLYSIIELLNHLFSDKYTIECEVLNSVNYGVPQNRKRSFIKIFKKTSVWNWPKESTKKLTVKDAIGHLPSIEAEEQSDIKWHYGRKHSPHHILWMKHTPTGESAFKNKVHFPKNKDGVKLNGYHDAYARISWDKPAPTITMRSDAISSNSKVHPGRLNNDNTYSDARVLSIHELLILSSLPVDWDIPSWATELLIRKIIGESVPPLLMKKIIEEI